MWPRCSTERRVAPAIVVVVIAVLLGACSLTGRGAQQPGGSPPVTSAQASSAAVATPGTSMAAATTNPPGNPPTPPVPAPPGASIAVEGGDPVEGALGTYTWHNVGTDAPWLNGTPIHIGSGEQLAVTLARQVAIERWTVGRALPGSRDGSGAIGVAEGTGGLPRFAPPPPGTWSIQVSVWFAGNQGTAAYYWLVEVD